VSEKKKKGGEKRFPTPKFHRRGNCTLAAHRRRKRFRYGRHGESVQLEEKRLGGKTGRLPWWEKERTVPRRGEEEGGGVAFGREEKGPASIQKGGSE